MSRIRKTCGDDFIIGLAVNDEPDIPAALQRESLSEIVALHDRDDMMDYITCGSGSYFDFYKLMPTILYPEKLGVDLAETLKGAVTHALVTDESHIRTPENAETVLGAGQADLIAIVRGQIADPHLANKTLSGRPEDIRGCLSCNQMCWGRRYRDYWISCLINPSAGREFEWGGDRFTPAATAKTVLVVGGGPAGLEAARAAAERGHRVTLAEAGPQLGGQFRMAGSQPRRAQILDLIAWYGRQLEKLRVRVDYNSYMDADEIAAFGADEVVLATGSLPAGTGFQKAMTHLEVLPGIERGDVWSVEDVMMRSARLKDRVVILDEGGNWRGVGTAWKMSDDGHQVTIVTADPLVGKELQRSAADFPARQTLARLGVAFETESAILEWTAEGARVVSLLTGAEKLVPAGSLVLATTNMAEDSLAGELAARGVRFRLISDCAGPRQAAFAFYEGRKAGIEL